MFTVVASLPLTLNKSNEIISVSKTETASGIRCLASHLQHLCILPPWSAQLLSSASVQNAWVSVFCLSPLLHCFHAAREEFVCPVVSSIPTDVCTHASVCLCHIIFNIPISKITHNRIKQTLEGEMCAGGVKHLCSLSSLESFSRPVFTEAYRMCLMFPWQRKR